MHDIITYSLLVQSRHICITHTQPTYNSHVNLDFEIVWKTSIVHYKVGLLLNLKHEQTLVTVNQPGLRVFRIILSVSPRYPFSICYFWVVCINLWLSITHFIWYFTIHIICYEFIKHIICYEFTKRIICYEFNKRAICYDFAKRTLC